GALRAEMCGVIVEVGGYRVAWIGYAQQDDGKTVRLMAQVGFDGDLEELVQRPGQLTWADSERGRGPMATTIRSGKPIVVRNLQSDAGFAPWRAQAHSRGLTANATFPLSVDGCV